MLGWNSQQQLHSRYLRRPDANPVTNQQ